MKVMPSLKRQRIPWRRTISLISSTALLASLLAVIPISIPSANAAVTPTVVIDASDPTSYSSAINSNVTVSNNEFQFSGSSSYLQFGQRNFGQTISIAAWVKLASNSSNIQTIFANTTANQAPCGFKATVNSWMSSDGKMIVEGGNGSSGSSIGSSTNTVTRDVWTHLTYVIDFSASPKVIRFYKDGQLVATENLNISGSVCTNNSAWYIGAMAGGSYSLNGAIRNIKIFDQLLSDQNVAEEYQGAPLFDFTSHTFTSCGATGPQGPSQTSCRTAYTSNWDESDNFFTVSGGIQNWKVPRSGTYRIIAEGAYGGGNDLEPYRGGYGARIQGDFQLTKNESLKILVGHLGNNAGGRGGGGGTFVTKNDNAPLIVAGGGGGSGDGGGWAATPPYYFQADASLSTSGRDGVRYESTEVGGVGGTNGSAGGVSGDSSWKGFPGAGYSGDASVGGAKSFLSGGVGGNVNTYSQGAFGGGGAGGQYGAGGGGGYSGGGSNSRHAPGGGGGSYNSGTNQINTIRADKTAGRVTILYVPNVSETQLLANSDFSNGTNSWTSSSSFQSYSVGSGGDPSINSGELAFSYTSRTVSQVVQINSPSDITAFNFSARVKHNSSKTSLQSPFSITATLRSAQNSTIATISLPSVGSARAPSEFTTFSRTVFTNSLASLSNVTNILFAITANETGNWAGNYGPVFDEVSLSEIRSGAIQISAPGAPTIGTATATGATTANVTFTEPASDGGSAITRYTATSSPGNITAQLNQAGSGTISVTGLSPNTSYTFTVTATNGAGTSVASSASNQITTSYASDLSPPNAVTASVSGRSVVVGWQTPTTLAGKTITGYQVEYSTSGTGSWQIASSSIAPDANSYTISNLTAGTSYYIRVAAKFSGGLGGYGYPWTKIYSTTTPTRASGLITYENGFGLGASDAATTNSSTNFTRIKYRMQANYGGALNYVEADFNRTLGTKSAVSETFDSISKLQVPTTSGSGSQFEIQANVTDLNIVSNVGTVHAGNALNGRLEIWPWDYGVEPASGLASRSAGTYDDSDTPTLGPSYGSFQLHNLSNPQTSFAWNRHGVADKFEVGFGNYSGTHSDWTFCADVADGCSNRTDFKLEIFINSPVTAQSEISIATPSNQTATTGTSFSFTPTVTNASGTKVFSIASGSLPVGLSINQSTGAITGTPVEVGTSTISIRVRDDGSTVDSGTFTITVASSSGLSMFIKNQAGTSQGIGTPSAFNTSLCGSGITSTLNYDWGTGRPTINSTSQSGCNFDGFTVYAKGSIKAPTTGVVTFCAISDDGFYLKINGNVIINNWVDQGPNSNCNATGTMNMVQDTEYPIEVWNHENGVGAVFRLLWSYTGQTRIAVPSTAFTTGAPSLSIVTPSSGLSATKGVPYSLNVVAVGGSGTKSFTVSSGTLPAGLTLNGSTGVISGTPTGTTSATVRITVTDTVGSAQTNEFTIAATGVPGTPTSATLTTTGVSGDGRLKASWTAPVDSGGSSITNYEIRFALSGVLAWSNWLSVNGLNGNTSASTEVILSGLQNSKTYVVQVRAINAVGTGPASESSSAVAATGAGASALGAPLSPALTTGDGRITLNFTANPIVGANVSSSVLFNTMNETCNREDYWIVRSNVLTAHQFTAGSAANITKFEIRMGAGLQQYPSQIRIVFYENGANNTIGTRLSGTLTFASSASNVAVYTGSITLSGAGTYWVQLEPTAAIANHYYCGTSSLNSTGSEAGWSQNRTRFAYIGLNGAATQYIAGAQYNYPLFRITAESAEAALNAITEYQYSLDGGTTWRSVAVGALAAGPSIVVTGLANGTTYDVRLRAVNSAGPGAIATFGTGRPGVGPSIPRDKALSLGNTPGQIVTEFKTPTTTGGLALTYQYRLKNSATLPASPTYYPVGPQRNVPITDVTNGGWTLCYSDQYRSIADLSTILNACNGKYIMLAAGATGNANYSLLAAGEREFVFKPTGRNVTTDNNGTFWYYNTAQSMGFAPTATISQSSADVFDRANELRMSWHLGHCGANKICGGWRVGSVTGLNGSTAYVRAIYTSTGSAAQSDEGWGEWTTAQVTTSGENNTLIITPITNDKTYSVQVRAVNELGNSVATVAQNIDARRATGPTITTQPVNKTLTLNQTGALTLTVVAQAAGQETLSYQWFKGGTAIQGATNATYTVTGPIDQAKATSVAGEYYVEVTGTLNNTSGTTRSSTVAVSVAAEPVIKTNPAVKNGTVGASYLNQLELNENTGTAPLTWALAPGSSLPAGLSLTSDGRIVGTPTISSAAAATSAAPAGSFAFNGTNSSLSIPASNDWATGTGDFTVEWWQYQTDNNLYPRIFTFGDIANNSLPLSAAIEGGLFYAWVGGTTYNFGNVGAYKNTWVHFAFVRSGNTLRVYKNGTLLGTNNTTNSVAAVNAPLVIGYKSNSTGAFGGFITNFHYVNGTALYNANFVTSTNVSAVANTKLLLLSSTAQTYLLDSGGANRTVTSNGVTFNSSSPRQGSSTKDVLQNANFASPLVNDPTRGWAQIVRSGGNAVVSGGGLIFSYGSSACTTQGSARMGEVQQKVTISQPTTVTFKIKVDARLWNRIGAGYSNPCHDPYQVTLTTSGGATATTSRQFSTEANATTATNASNSLSNNNVLWREWTLQVTTTSANEVLTISLFGLDSGYWAGNYGPKFYDAELSLANGGGGGGANASTTVIVTDANGRTASHTFTIDVSPAMSITTKTLANAATGAAYSQTLTAEGGNGSYTWAVVGGVNNLPGGLTLTSNGVLGGNVANDATSRSFTVQVTDGNGAVTTQSLSLTVASGLPGEPTGLTVGTVGDGTLPLTWTAPVNTGGSAITQYVIAYSAPKGTDPADTEEIDSGTVTVSASGLTFPYNLTGLKNGRTYTINVKARNSSALGNASSNATGKPVVVASAPTNLSMSLANGGLTVRWKKPIAAGGNPITSYKVQCSVDGTTWTDITDRITTSGDDSSVVAATGLTIGSAYNCRVAAVTSTGDGAFVATDSAITLATPPSAPRGAISNSVVGANITSAVQTPGRMTVTWSKSANSNGSAITSYVATVARNFGENNEIRRSCSVTANETDDTSGYSCTVLGIPKKGNFRIWVIAVNAIGNSAEITGDLSQSGASQTLTIPNGINGSTYALGRADFSIGATASSGLPAQYTSTTTSICTITNRGLVKLIAPGTCTVNVDQDGTDAGGNETEYAAATQATVTFTVSDRVPGTPRFNAVTPGNTSLTVTWFAPSNSGGTPTHYDIQTAVYDPNNSGAALTWSSSTVFEVGNALLSQQVSSLTNATQYKVRIRARNGANDANASSWVVYSGTVTVYGVPAKPTISSFTSDAENGAATIEWTAPANNGSAITGYEVAATANGQTTRYCNTGGDATSCVIYGLANKVQYSFVLVAQNIAGSSANSDTYLATLPGMSQTISLLTTPASDGWTVDSPSYQIQALTNSGATLTFATGNSAICTVSSTGSVTFVSAGACQITISQSGTGTRYEAATNVVVNFTVAPSAPSAPRITGFVSAGSGLTINWSAPSRAGGAITGYTLTASRDGSNTVTCTVNALTCEMNTLTKGLIYNFSLIATNAAGNSPASTVRTAGWYAVPVAPVLSTAVASNSDGRAIEVTWIKSTSDGGSEISRYVVSATAGAVTKTCAVAETGSATSSCVIRDLRAGTQYAVTVKAENAVGLSDASNSLNVTPGIAQVVSISSPASSPVSKSFGDPDFRINASVDSGNQPTFASSDTNVCTVDANGRVRIVGVGTCVITVSHPGSSDANESQYKASNSATLTINIAAIAPSAPTLVRLTPGDAKVTVALTAPTSLGGGTLTTYEYSLDNGSTWVTPQSNITSTSFEISGLTNDTLYSVRVRANNGSAGAQSNVLSATPYARPEAPLPLLATGENGSVALSWTVPQSFSGTLLRYEVFRRVAGVGDFALVHSTANANTLSYSDSGLTAGTTYEYQVRAVADVANAEVNGLFTNSSFATTFSAPSAPRNVGASTTFTSSPALAITWLAPLTNGGSAITGYTVTATAGGQNFTCSANASTFGCTIENLVAGTAYSITVVATSASGTSIASDPAVTVTPIGKPGAPTAVAVTTDLDSGSATITWTAPASNGGSAITSYVARAYLGNTSTSTPLNCTRAHVDGTSSYTCTITGLAYKTSYVFAVAANNAVGTGELSVATSAVNLQRSQTITFNALPEVTWLTRSILLNARASSALAITYTATPASVCTVNGSSVTIAGIGNCTVTATQDGANSAFGVAESVSRTFAVNATQPSAVTLLSVIPGDALNNGNNRVDAGKLTVSWSAATELGGSASASYLISYATNPNFSDELSVTTNNTSIVLSDLTPGATYNIRIRVLTPDYQAGSEWSNLLQGTVLSVPSAPTGTAVTAGAGTLTVTWEALDQAANGGSPILGYRVKALLGLADNSPATCVTSGTSCVIGGLDGSQFYTVQIVAINALGESEPYEFADDYRPSAAQEITAAGSTKSRSVGKHRIGASTNSGLPLTYTVISNSPTDPVAGRTVCEVDANGELTFDLAGTCRVKISQNGRGNGNRASSYLPAADKEIEFVVEADVPSNVLDFTLSSGDRSLTVSWTKPTQTDDKADGGRALKGYEVTWFASLNTSGNPLQTGEAVKVLTDAEIDAKLAGPNPTAFRAEINNPNTTSYTINDLSNGVYYTVIVRAINNGNLKSARS